MFSFCGLSCCTCCRRQWTRTGCTLLLDRTVLSLETAAVSVINKLSVMGFDMVWFIHAHGIERRQTGTDYVAFLLAALQHFCILPCSALGWRCRFQWGRQDGRGTGRRGREEEPSIWEPRHGCRAHSSMYSNNLAALPPPLHLAIYSLPAHAALHNIFLTFFFCCAFACLFPYVCASAPS